MDKSKIIVVTGGFGFIGSLMIDELVRRGYENIVVVDPLANGDQLSNLSDHLHKIKWFVDIDHLPIYRPEAIGAVIHLGAITDTKYKFGPGLYKHNVALALKARRLADEHNCVFQFASSASVYGNENKINNLYAFSKFTAENEIMRDTRARPRLGSNHHRVHIFRYFNVYSITARERSREIHKIGMLSPYHNFLNQLETEGRIVVYRHGDIIPKRDFIYVGHLVELQVDILERRNELPTGIYDIGSGDCRSFESIALDVCSNNGADPNTAIQIEQFSERMLAGYQFDTKANMSWRTEYGF